MSVPAKVAAAAAEADSQLALLADAARTGNLHVDQLRPQLPNVTPMQMPPVQQDLPAPPAPEPIPAPAPTAELPNAPAPVSEPVAVPTSMELELARLRQQLSTTEGRLNARTADEEATRRQLQALQQEIEALRNPPAPPAPAFSNEEAEAFGPENVDLVQRIIRHEFSSRIDGLERQINELRGTVHRLGQSTEHVQQVTAQTALQRYEAELDAQVPGWDEIAKEPKFLDWLEKVDILSGQKYGQLLSTAHKSANTSRVVYIFNLYKQENGITAPAPAPAPVAPPAGVDPTGHIAPAPGAPTPPPTTPPQPKIWTTAEVDALYAGKQKGFLTEAEFKAKEAEYYKALREGRVQAS